MKSISEVRQEKSLPVFAMFNLTVLATCLGVMNGGDNGRIASTTRHYIHEFEARTTFLTWKIKLLN